MCPPAVSRLGALTTDGKTCAGQGAGVRCGRPATDRGNVYLCSRRPWNPPHPSKRRSTRYDGQHARPPRRPWCRKRARHVHLPQRKAASRRLCRIRPGVLGVQRGICRARAPGEPPTRYATVGVLSSTYLQFWFWRSPLEALHIPPKN